MIRIILILSLALLFQACKKDSEKSLEYWTNLQAEKLTEIITLTSNYSCEDKDKVSIQEINAFCPSYFLVHQKDVNTFNNLWKEYQQIQSKIFAIQGSLNYDTSPCISQPVIRTDCIEGKLKLILVSDLKMDEVNTMLTDLIAEFESIQQNTPCTNATEWMQLPTFNSSCELVYIPIPVSFNNFGTESRKKTDLLQALNIRKMVLSDGKCRPVVGPPSVIKCINNKAVIITE